MQYEVFTDNLTILGDGTEAHPLTAGVTGPNFADAETPVGATPGTAFTLTHAPNPAASLILVWNGVTLEPVTDFALAGNALTMVHPVQIGDSFLCWYRH